MLEQGKNHMLDLRRSLAGRRKKKTGGKIGLGRNEGWREGVLTFVFLVSLLCFDW